MIQTSTITPRTGDKINYCGLIDFATVVLYNVYPDITTTVFFTDQEQVINLCTTVAFRPKWQRFEPTNELEYE